jgi:hypothetical protein
VIFVAAVSLLAVGCGGGGAKQADGAALDRACKSTSVAAARIGPVRRLGDAAPALRRTIAVDRAVSAALRAHAPDEVERFARVRLAIAQARGALDAIVHKDPLQATTMSTIGSSVPAAKRAAAEARELVRELCDL